MMSELFEFPEIAENDVAWRNGLLGRSRVIRACIGTLETSMRFFPVDVAMNSRSLLVRAGDYEWRIQVVDWDLLPFVTAVLESGTLSSLPDEIALAVLEATLTGSLDALGQRIGTRVELSGFADTEIPETWHSVSVTLDCQTGASLPATISGPRASMYLLHDLVQRSPAGAAIDIETLPVDGRIVVGRSWLSVDELRSINGHDVVLVEESSFLEDRSAVMAIPGYQYWQVSVGENELKVGEAVESTEPPADRISPSVPISFELRPVRLRVDQLAQLLPETTLPYEQFETVTLCSHGKPFAAGELVDVGGNLGVRIHDLSHQIVNDVIDVDQLPEPQAADSEPEPEDDADEPGIDIPEAV